MTKRKKSLPRELTETAYRIRHYLEQYRYAQCQVAGGMTTGYPWSTERHLAGYCGIASYLMHFACASRGYNSRVRYGKYNGEYHAWLILLDKPHSGTIVDITATQFNTTLHRVHIATKYSDEAQKYSTLQQGQPAIDRLDSFCPRWGGERWHDFNTYNMPQDLIFPGAS